MKSPLHRMDSAGPQRRVFSLRLCIVGSRNKISEKGVVIDFYSHHEKTEI